MIVTVTYCGKHFGSPMDGMRDDDLLRFIKSQIELGRTVHITPEEIDLSWAGEEVYKGCENCALNSTEYCDRRVYHGPEE